MKKFTRTMLLALCLCFAVLPANRVNAQIPIPILEIIKAGVKKAIKAVDLKIQRLQNKTIWLQNAQKVLENTLAKAKLDEIGDWTERQKEQYRLYFDELKKVKSLIIYYQRVKDITAKQVRLVNEYQRVWPLLHSDGHFSAKELDYMAQVYSGILKESLKNMEQINLVVRSFSTQMDDAERLELINSAADRVDENYDDLLLFNRQNMILSLQRAKTLGDIEAVKKLYGLDN